MSLFSWFRPRGTATDARERLKMVLAHERAGSTDAQKLVQLRDEILAVIAKHFPIDRDRVNVKLDTGSEVSTLEIDIEMPASTMVRA